MAEAHQAERIGLVLGALDELRNLGNIVHLLQHAQHRLVGAAMQRPPQRGHAAGDAGVGVGAAGAGQPHGRGRGVLLVIGVQNEDAVERLRQHRVRHILLARTGEHHVHEVLGIAQAVLRIDERLALVELVGPGRHRWHFRNEAMGNDLAVCRVEVIQPAVIEGRHGPRHANHHRHGMRAAAEAAEHVFHLVVQQGMVADRLLERHFLLGRRQFAVKQQIADFHVVGLVGQFLDRVAAVIQQAFVAVDVGDGRRAARRGGEAGVVGEIAVRTQRTDVDDRLAVGALLDRQFDRRAAVAEGEGDGFFHRDSKSVAA